MCQTANKINISIYVYNIRQTRGQSARIEWYSGRLGGWWGEDGRTTIAIGIRRQNCSFGLFIVAVAVGGADVCLSRSFRAACASVTLPT